MRCAESLPARDTIQTSLGRIWIKKNGDMRVWWPYGARAGELAMSVIQGRARWDPATKGWCVPGKKP